VTSVGHSTANPRRALRWTSGEAGDGSSAPAYKAAKLAELGQPSEASQKRESAN
jgi:hypothetical protein